MKIYTDVLKADGFTDDEIQHIQQHCDIEDRTGRFSRLPALVYLNGDLRLCCWSEAEILNKLRPGIWFSLGGFSKPHTKKPRRTPGQRQRTRRLQASAMARKRNKQPGSLIKVYLAFPDPKPDCPSGEHLWARRMTNDTAKIENIPFGTSKVAQGDLVRIDRAGEILEILEHVARTRLLRYGDPQSETGEQIAKRFADVRQHLQKYDIHTEGMFAGICSISVPLDIDEEQRLDIADQLDCDLLVHDDEK